MRLILATSNPNKLQEIQEIYTPLYKDTLKILSFSALVESFEIQENGTTFQENALLKSKTVFQTLKTKNLLFAKDIILSDDSGICVEALQEAPGIYSARYSGGDDKDNLEKLLLEVANLPTKTS
ncbi:MAG: non-canonical purine NTP pyrophosphatase, partial [Helicobacter sp.]|nr:non-canonical purine NTP pyrophosphatase [Helicobacter sp.]